MIGTRAVYNACSHCDLLLMVGTDYPYSNFLPAKDSVIQIDERTQVLAGAHRQRSALPARGPTLKLLLDKVGQGDTRFWDK